MKARDQPSRVERPGRGAGAVSEAPPTGGRLLDSVLGRTLRGMSETRLANPRSHGILGEQRLLGQTSVRRRSELETVLRHYGRMKRQDSLRILREAHEARVVEVRIQR